MGIELLEIGVKMRKSLIFTIRGCFRSVCNHPFLVGMLCFLIFLYRSFPFIFSLLVSASPILVCTAVLLGTLLSFGQPNIPDIEIEEKTTNEAVSLKTGVSEDAAVIEKNESYYVERFSEKRRDEAEQSTEQPDLSAGKLGRVRREDGSDDDAPLIQERSREIELKDGDMWEANRESDNLRHNQKTEWNEERFSDGEVMENRYASIARVNDETDDGKSEAESFDSERVNVDSLDSPPRSPWKRVEEREDEEEEVEEEDEEDDALDSGSDRAESSSPDASMADIMPMLDELHPLLDEEAPQPAHMSRGGSDTASERSAKSSTSSHESDDETENHEDTEVADDENEDEEDAQGDKDEQTKSAITWTEEDQKNLMDLGSSEIERNLRLENLILRRRARKNMSMFSERNLIDLEASDLAFNIAPISTRRQNPFDLPNDSYDNSGLPPIPGSAPSILLPRRNPFDIPYDSSEEKPNLMGDGFQEEFTTFQSREPFFRRHESFNVGPSLFAPNRQDVKMRPYFVPERTVSEESTYSSFQRQSSELSDSKVSSVPETESIGSVEDLEDRKPSEEDNEQEVEVISQTKEVTEEGPSGESGLPQQEKVNEEDEHLEPELMSKMESVSEHVGHGSQSSEEEDSLELGQVGNRDVGVSEFGFQLEDVADHYPQGSATHPVEVQAAAVEQRYSRGSSSSSLSEVSERVFTEMEGEGSSVLEERRDDVAEESPISTQTSVESTDTNITSALVNDIPHREPVYDTSPREVGRNFLSSSISSNVPPESDLGSPPVLVKRTVSFTERESEGCSQEIEKDIPSNIEMLPESSIGHPLDESRPIDVNIREHDDINWDFSGVDHRSDSENSSAAIGIISHASIPLKSSVEALVEENLMEEQRWDDIPSSSADKNIHTLVKSSDDQNLDQSREKYSLISERYSLIEVSEPAFEGQLRAEHSIGMEETIQSPNSDADVYHEAGEKLISTPSAEGNTSFFFDKAMYEPKFKHLNEVQKSSTPVKSSMDIRTTQTSSMPEVQELDQDLTSNVNSPLTPDFISIPSSTSETRSPHHDVQTIIEEADEIKEIDEGLLSELDNVGDFSIQQWGSGSSEFEKHIDSVRESLPSAHHMETSTMRVVNSVEENTIENAVHSESPREHIHIYGEGVENISEVQTSKTHIVEHIDGSKMESYEIDVQDSPDQETSEDETFSKENDVQAAHFVINQDRENISEIPEVEVRSIEDADSVSNKAELTSVETEIMVGDAEVSYQGEVDTDITSRMLELEASKTEDIDQAFKQINAKEIKKEVVFEPAQVEQVVEETITEHSEDGIVHRNSSVTDSTDVTSVLEVRPIEDASLDNKQLNNGSTGSPRLPESVDRTLHVVESEETRGTCSELHAAEPIPSEGTTLPPKQVLDGNTENQLNLNSDDGSVEVKADELGSSVEESSAKEVSASAAEQPDHEVEAPKELHSTASAKGKGKISRGSSSTSSSSSSSSSKSSSSDSDRE